MQITTIPILLNAQWSRHRYARQPRALTEAEDPHVVPGLERPVQRERERARHLRGSVGCQGTAHIATADTYHDQRSANIQVVTLLAAAVLMMLALSVCRDLAAAWPSHFARVPMAPIELLGVQVT